MKKRKISGMVMGIFAAGMFLWVGHADAAKTTGKKVAEVNGVAISKKDFDKQMQHVQARLAQRGKLLKGAELETMKKNIVDTLIDRELLYQASRKDGIKVSKKAIDEKIDGLKKRFGKAEDFSKILNKADITEAQLRVQLKQQMAVQKLVEKKISKGISISDKEARAFYDSKQEFFKQPEQVRASHILVKVDAKAKEKDVKAARKKIEGIQERLKKGEDFAKLAKETSQCPSSAKGGDLGFFKRGQMVKPFEDAVFSMKTGQVSDIIRTRFGFHIIKATGKKPATTVAFAKVKDKIKGYLKQKKIQEGVKKLVVSLKKEAKIEKFLPATLKK